jgi:hypothetical protein
MFALLFKIFLVFVYLLTLSAQFDLIIFNLASCCDLYAAISKIIVSFLQKIPDSSVSITTGYRLDGWDSIP